MTTGPAWDSPPWQTKYAEYAERYHELANEVEHALRHALSEAGIKVHTISSRIKSKESIEGKLRRTEQKNGLMYLFDPEPRYHFGLKDVIGVRVVCMFLGQIEQIVNQVRRTFNVIEEDRKTRSSDVTSFGYMSDHLVCELGENFNGPRYDPVKGIAFELQVRTIAMDAWAAVSHHIDYKSEFGIPAELKRDFHALSGLFYVADTHFEMFSKQISDFRNNLKNIEVANDEEPIPINQDIMHSYLLEIFPDREVADSDSIEEFLIEVLTAGYKSMQEVDQDLQRGLPALKMGELDNPPCDEESGDETRFTSIGAARGALDLANEEFFHKRTRGGRPDSYAKYRKFVHPKS
ncbi:RelA/SpoT domain-containing protein [Burkholderia sp. Ac-20392]|uniref:GTP pyrophosphokinase n=1 Tax=Burkholderia sp. Ac-20392 TaxID=2703905 RepID=UPI00197D6F46|nr:RelA/SpoT domain-containing protein [Burkholderia sp. Ac-20392]MBN3794576.1 RelA/SpoT domain-containing protein [Burkholderia sp. Ac-20392]